MSINFNPIYSITPKLTNFLLKIESIKERVLTLPLTPKVLHSLRESARLYTTHYSTLIEGNRLDVEQIDQVLKHEGHFPGRERDESEVKGYYSALNQVEQWAAAASSINEKMIQTLHALVMANGISRIKPSPYRDGQNVIRDSRTRAIIYLPPEAKDVPGLMIGMASWIKNNNQLPCPIVAAIAHYQFATIHPYYDGNGRTARLLTTLILHLGGYDLKGLYSLEEYYARNLDAYYQAISIGPSHNYYMGRPESDITSWIEYFVEGMSISFENVLKRMADASTPNSADHSELLRTLDPKQRKALELFQDFDNITAKQIASLFGFKPRTASKICHTWVEAGFIEIADFSNKARKYRLARNFKKLLIL